MAVQGTNRCRRCSIRRARLARARSGRRGHRVGKAACSRRGHGQGRRPRLRRPRRRGPAGCEARHPRRQPAVSDRVAVCPRWPRQEGLRAAASAALRRASSRWWVPRLVASLAATHFTATSMSSSSGACSRGLPKSRGTMTPWALRCDPKCTGRSPRSRSAGRFGPAPRGLAGRDNVRRDPNAGIGTDYGQPPATQLVRDRRVLARVASTSRRLGFTKPCAALAVPVDGSAPRWPRPARPPVRSGRGRRRVRGQSDRRVGAAPRPRRRPSAGPQPRPRE